MSIYILLDGINDSVQDAMDLINFKKTPSKVNLIEYNQVSNVPYQKSSKSSTKLFMDLLEKIRYWLILEEVEVRILVLLVDN